MFTPKSAQFNNIESLGVSLVQWYQDNRRDLPWRSSKDPYRVWISEVMLQQTTVKAVIPFYERFMKRFPDVQSLASASLEDVYEYWAGLGYYSRARNLHKSAQLLAKTGFPKTAAELLELPGFGPYTARAVASLCFEEPVGVLDGNVIRIICRVFGLEVEWWQNSVRQQLQIWTDTFVRENVTRKSKTPISSNHINQAMMELGATLCTTHNPLCFTCPWQKKCQSFKQGKVEAIPLSKPRKVLEHWVWTPEIMIQKSKASKGMQIALIENQYAPFLKKAWIFPGQVEKKKSKPQDYDLKHTITHHNIYIPQLKLSKINQKHLSSGTIRWVEIKDLKKVNPASLLQKVLKKVHSDS